MLSPHQCIGADCACCNRLEHDPGCASLLFPHQFTVSDSTCRNRLEQLLCHAHRQRVQSVDMRQSHLWYPMARALDRKIIYHAGPTNSGKTYNALQVWIQCTWPKRNNTAQEQVTTRCIVRSIALAGGLSCCCCSCTHACQSRSCSSGSHVSCAVCVAGQVLSSLHFVAWLQRVSLGRTTTSP